MSAPQMTVGGQYNWRHQPERLIYLGYNWSGNGYWHQFAIVGRPSVIWCEVQTNELDRFEASLAEKCPSRSAKGQP